MLGLDVVVEGWYALEGDELGRLEVGRYYVGLYNLDGTWVNGRLVVEFGI